MWAEALETETVDGLDSDPESGEGSWQPEDSMLEALLSPGRATRRSTDVDEPFELDDLVAVRTGPGDHETASAPERAEPAVPDFATPPASIPAGSVSASDAPAKQERIGFNHWFDL
jgi:hypothetical protein